MKMLCVLTIVFLPIIAFCQELVKTDENLANKIKRSEGRYTWIVDSKFKLTTIFQQRRIDQKWIMMIETHSEAKDNIQLNSSTLADIIDQSWMEFKKEVPTADLGSISFDVSICNDIWLNLKENLEVSIPKIEGKTEPKAKRLSALISSILSAESEIDKFKAIAKKHGKAVYYIGPWERPLIEESLWGVKYQQIVHEPHLGLKMPLMVSIVLE